MLRGLGGTVTQEDGVDWVGADTAVGAAAQTAGWE